MMEEIVVARNKRSTIILGTLLAIPTGPFALLLLWRLPKMKLSVTRDSVIVVNFFKQHEIPLDEAIIHDRRIAGDPGVSDSGGPMDTDRRLLSVSHGSGKKIPITVAPTLGSRLDTIAEDLYQAIDKMQAVPV